MPVRLLLVLSIVLTALSGCSSPVILMPAPAAFASDEKEPFARFNVEDDTELQIPYVTNRTALLPGPHPIYTFFPSENLDFGMAHVRIGEGELTWPQLRALATNQDEYRRPPLHLQQIDREATLEPDEEQPLSPEAQAYFTHLNNMIAESYYNDLIIYVHGFNNPVWRGFAQTGQFYHYTGRNEIVMTFSWPSAGGLLSYASDVRTARASAPAFAEAIKLIARHTHAEHIHILAFSAGARVVSEGLALLEEKAAPQSREALRERLRLGQIYYAAPDEDLDRFVSDLTRYIDLVQRVSIAVNTSDSALRLARRFQGISRAGLLDVTELTREQLEFLAEASQRMNFDVIKIRYQQIPDLSPRSHSFWYSNPWVSRDIMNLFLWHKTPEERGLVPAYTEGGIRIWEFPPDFEQRLKPLSAGNPAGS